jgi:hypothetical protein
MAKKQLIELCGNSKRFEIHISGYAGHGWSYLINSRKILISMKTRIWAMYYLQNSSLPWWAMPK